MRNRREEILWLKYLQIQKRNISTYYLQLLENFMAMIEEELEFNTPKF